MSDRTSKSKRHCADEFRCITQRNHDEGPAKIDAAESLAEFTTRFKLARENPTAAVKAEKLVIGRSRAEHDRASLMPSLVAFEAAGALKASREMWKTFANDSAWSEFKGHKPDPEKPDEHLRWVMVFVHEAKDKRGKERANVYRGALEAKFEEGAKVETLLSLIKEAGGIDKAYREALRHKKSGSAAVSSKNSSAQRDNAADDSGRKDDKEEKIDPKDSTASAANSSSSSSSDSDSDPDDEALYTLLLRKAKKARKDGYKPLLVLHEPHDFAKVTERYVGTGEVHLRCDLVLGNDGWIEVTCKKAWRKSPKSIH